MAGASRPSWLADATEAATTFVAGKTYDGNGSVLFDGGTTAGYGGQFDNTGTHYVEFTVGSSFRLYGIGCYYTQLLGLNLYRRLDASTWSASLGVLTTLSAVDTWGQLWPDILPAGTYKLSVSSGIYTPYTTYTELFCERAIVGLVLFVDGSDVKAWNGSTLSTIGTTPVTQSMFETSGVSIDDVSDTPSSVIDTLSQGSKVVVYKTSTSTSTSTLTAVPNRRLLVMNQDISLSSVSNIDSFSLTATTSGSGAIRALASVDGGTTWQSLIGGVWSMVDSSDLDSVLSNGFTPTALNAVTSTQWNTLRGTQDRIRFAFYIQQVSSTDTASIDTLSSVFDMAGTWHGARLGTDYTFYYDKNHLIVSILSAGSYKVNYEDGTSSEDGTSGVTDHGALTGLTDDDHLHYLTAERGDVRYTLNTSSRLLPSGGAIGEVVGKTGSDSYAVGWIAVSGGGSTGGEMSQETHLNVVNGDSGSAVSSSNPKTYTIAMPYQAEFKVGKVNVLKLVAGVQNSVVTWCSFDNSDSTSFVANSYILFDGYMHLKTSYTETVTRVGSLGSGYQYRTTVDISNFTRLETVYVS